MTDSAYDPGAYSALLVERRQLVARVRELEAALSNTFTNLTNDASRVREIAEKYRLDSRRLDVLERLVKDDLAIHKGYIARYGPYARVKYDTLRETADAEIAHTTRTPAEHEETKK
jgi:hypothetical protein